MSGIMLLFIEISNEELTESHNVIEPFIDKENSDEYRPTKKLKVWLFLVSTGQTLLPKSLVKAVLYSLIWM